jgi:hypothetical protein
MKKVSIIITLSLVIISLSSCLKTLHPIFTVKDIVYEPGLIGNWMIEKDGKREGGASIINLAMATSVEFPGNIASIKNKGYLVTYNDDKGNITEQYIAFLAPIGKHLYFDYYPLETKTEQKLDNFFLAHYIKVHTSYRLDILPNGTFELSQLDEGYLTKLIDEKKVRISHEKNDDGNIMIVTASTSELQQYLIKYGDEPEAYRNDKTKFLKN